MLGARHVHGERVVGLRLAGVDGRERGAVHDGRGPDPVEGSAYHRGVAHVEDVAEGAGPELGHGGVHLLPPAAADAEPRAGGGEGPGDAEVDAAGAAGNEDVAPRVVEARPHQAARRPWWA